MLRSHSLRVIVMLGALAIGPAAVTARQPARPEPLRRQVQIVLVEDVIGQFLKINDDVYYVRDLRMARRPDGSTAYVSYDLEDEAGERFRHPGDMENLPVGSVEAFSLDDAFGLGARMLWWADASGEVHGMNLHPGDQVVGPGGSVVTEPSRCTLTVTGYCVPEGCDGQCKPFPDCECVPVHWWPLQSERHCPVMGGYACKGPCGVGNCAEEPVNGGCTCHP